ncbi:DNA recombination protein RmuC [Alloscardovia omnicolens]|uniref:DNA recombination protein RmuC n=1 Tax=Alloscardovia omnicolens TaxID=419015 RepID=UPI003A61D052
MFETVLIFVISLVLGAICGFAYARFLGKKAGNNHADIGQLENQLEETAVARDQFKEQAELLRSDLAAEREATAKLEGTLSGVREQLSFAQEELIKAQNAEKERVERERLKELKREEELRLKQEQELNEESRVLKALSPVQKNLDVLQQKVTQIEESRKSEMGKLGEQLLGLGKAQEKLDKETTSLAMALRNNKVRGAWGEAQLKNIVESAGLRDHVDFETQYSVRNAEGKQQRPDMVVFLPDGKFIPIDAKVPYSAYQKACEISDAASEQELQLRDQYLAEHAKALRSHIDTLGSREYWKNDDDRVAPDFVIAFIPNESLLQAALDVDPTILDYAFNKQVALTSPVTLWSVLKSVAFAWQQQILSEEAQQLFDLSRELFGRLGSMSKNAAKLGKTLGKAVQDYNLFVGSLQTKVVPTARKLNKLDQSIIYEEPQAIENEKNAEIRDITAPELLAAWDDETES